MFVPDNGACKGMPIELFYPEQGHYVNVRKAKDTCNACPVQARCLKLAIDTPADEDWGVWGGTTKNERRTIRNRQLSIAA